MFFGGEDLSLSDAAVSFARCLAISDPKEKMPEPSIDPSEVGDKVIDALALKQTWAFWPWPQSAPCAPKANIFCALSAPKMGKNSILFTI